MMTGLKSDNTNVLNVTLKPRWILIRMAGFAQSSHVINDDGTRKNDC